MVLGALTMGMYGLRARNMLHVVEILTELNQVTLYLNTYIVHIHRYILYRTIPQQLHGSSFSNKP